jgi:alanyl-tRNA synthetase
MLASEIRAGFLNYFMRQGHVVRPSASLVPADDPTLLFTNAGMVQFKRIFLGLDEPTFGRRAATVQKCVRAGGKHNDLEQVGHTARHHTFFEMLGNFSFGDYFKREAIRFGWEFVTRELGIDPSLIRVTVFHEDDEARKLWREETGLADSRIYGLGERDNFWQMADTGPCGPCSEIYVDLAHVARDWEFPKGAGGEWTDLSRAEFSQDAFVRGAEEGRFLEIWNLVFMQFDRQQDGRLVPLPRPSVDTGAGLERIAAVMQGVTSNFHTDVFRPLIEEVAAVTAMPYADAPQSWGGGQREKGGGAAEAAASFRVLADHARAVAFLLADGVFPSNEGRGYVLRRILRRASRHAWLLGRKSEPTLARVVERVIATMADHYPELKQRSGHIVETTRAEEVRFLATITEGMQRFDAVAPAASTQGSRELRGTISGEDAFRLYDTYGFPIDLTDLMARERGYTVDLAGFERALDQQRMQSKADRKSRGVAVRADELGNPAEWEIPGGRELQGGAFVGYDQVEVETRVTAKRELGASRVAVILEESPFYAESGGQVSDHGVIEGDEWRVTVDEVRKVDGKVAAIGTREGEITFGRAVARVPGGRRRDTERNHTATHLLHAALRRVLGEHVHQAGSLVAPDRLRFDFTHHGPVKAEALDEIEREVNAVIWAAVPVEFEQRSYKDALEMGAMALFGEKYGDLVRIVRVPGVSIELCGGTHVRNTSEIGLIRVVSESGIAAGQRRIEALTGPSAFAHMRGHESNLSEIAALLKTTPDGAARKVKAVIEERRAFEKKIEQLQSSGPSGGGEGGGDSIASLVNAGVTVNGARLVIAPVSVADVRQLQALGDRLRERLASGVGALAASLDDGKHILLVVVTDDLRERGIHADALVRDLAALGGGRGGGKPHMAQAGLPEAGRVRAVLDGAAEIIRAAITRTA